MAKYTYNMKTKILFAAALLLMSMAVKAQEPRKVEAVSKTQHAELPLQNNPKFMLGATQNTFTDGINSTTFSTDERVVIRLKLPTVSASLSVAGGKYGTFVAPFDVTLPDGIVAYSAEINGSSVTLTQVADGGEVLRGKTPVILKNTTNALIEDSFNGPDDTKGAETVTVGSIVGFYKQGVTVPNDDHSYVLQTQNGEQAFYKVTGSFTGTKNRCYVIDPSQSAAQRLTIAFSDVTGIDELTSSPAGKSATYYNLNGQRVNATVKGIVIVNGKKHLIK